MLYNTIYTIVKQLGKQQELQVNQKELTSDLYKNKPVDRGVDKLSTKVNRFFSDCKTTVFIFFGWTLLYGIQ